MKKIQSYFIESKYNNYAQKEAAVKVVTFWFSISASWLIHDFSLTCISCSKDRISVFRQVLRCHNVQVLGNRSSHRRYSINKGVHINFTKVTGKYQCQCIFFNKFLVKKGLCHSCFPVNVVKFLRTPFLENTSGRLLLG